MFKKEDIAVSVIPSVSISITKVNAFCSSIIFEAMARKMKYVKRLEQTLSQVVHSCTHKVILELNSLPGHFLDDPLKLLSILDFTNFAEMQF